MIQKHFGFTDIPFARAAPTETLLKTERLTRARNRLQFVVRKHGIGVLVGPAGAGKTTVARVLAAELSDHRCVFIYILCAVSSPADLLRTIAWRLGIEGYRIGVIVQKLKAELLQRVQKHLTTVLVIDESQHLSHECFAALAQIMTRDMDAEDVLSLILIGQLSLLDHLSLSINESFAQRVLLQHTLPVASRDEIMAYLDWQVARVGGKAKIFKANCRELIYTASGGALRVVDQIATEALYLAAEQQKQAVDNGLVSQAIENLRRLKHQS